MSSVTPRLGFQKLDFNTPNWDVPTNQNWDLADFALVEGGRFDVPAGSAAAITNQLLATPSPADLYELKYYAVVTQAATTSSSLNISVTYTDADTGVVNILTATAQTGNTVGAIVEGVFVLNVQNVSNVTVSVAYTSAGTTPMQYAAHFRLVQT